MYIRLVLAHTPDPFALLKKVKNICNNHTILALEEPITQTSYCYPKSNAFDRHLELYQALGSYKKLDFNIGTRLLEIAQQAGIKPRGVRQVQRAYNYKTAQLIAYRRTLECADKYLQYNFITKIELENLLSELKNLANKEYYISGTTMCQIWGTF